MPPSMTLLNSLSDHQFLQYFGNVFEHSPWVIQSILKNRPFHSRENFLESLLQIIQNSPETLKASLIRNHPELGYDKIPLTPESRMEQNQAGLNTLSREQKNRLIELNTAYQEKFGFPFVICVRNHPDYSAILTALQKRLSSEKAQETETALYEIHAIATHRIEDRITALSENRITLSTHVLDLVTGIPASHVRLNLFCQEDLLFEGTTNEQGRCQIQEPGLVLTPGSYHLAFHLADYFRTKHYALTDPPFLNQIRIDFGIATTLGQNHYHVPLLASPYGFSTYRGS